MKHFCLILLLAAAAQGKTPQSISLHPANPLLNDAMEATERAATLTRQLLAYAGKGRFLLELVDISVLVRDISALVRSSIPKHVMVRLDLAEPLPLVEADPAQMQQLIMNLVINGAEDYFIPQSDTLIFRGRPDTEVHLLEGTGHCAMSKAAEVLPMIIGWLRAQFASPSAS